VVTPPSLYLRRLVSNSAIPSLLGDPRSGSNQTSRRTVYDGTSDHAGQPVRDATMVDVLFERLGPRGDDVKTSPWTSAAAPTSLVTGLTHTDTALTVTPLAGITRVAWISGVTSIVATRSWVAATDSVSEYAATAAV